MAEVGAQGFQAGDEDGSTDATLGIVGDDGTSDEDESSVGWGATESRAPSSRPGRAEEGRRGHRGQEGRQGHAVQGLQQTSLEDGGQELQRSSSVTSQSEERGATGETSEDESLITASEDDIIIVADDEEGLDGEEEFENMSASNMVDNQGHRIHTVAEERAGGSQGPREGLRVQLPMAEAAHSSSSAHSSTPRLHRGEDWGEASRDTTQPGERPRDGSGQGRRRSNDSGLPGPSASVSGSSLQAGSHPIEPGHGGRSSFEDSEGQAHRHDTGEQEQEGEEEAMQEASSHQSWGPAEEYDPLYDFGGSMGGGFPQAAGAQPRDIAGQGRDGHLGRIEYRPHGGQRLSTDRPVARPGGRAGVPEDRSVRGPGAQQGHERSKRRPVLPAVAGNAGNSEQQQQQGTKNGHKNVQGHYRD